MRKAKRSPKSKPIPAGRRTAGKSSRGQANKAPMATASKAATKAKGASKGGSKTRSKTAARRASVGDAAARKTLVPATAAKAGLPRASGKVAASVTTAKPLPAGARPAAAEPAPKKISEKRVARVGAPASGGKQRAEVAPSGSGVAVANAVDAGGAAVVPGSPAPGERQTESSLPEGLPTPIASFTI